MPNVVELIEQDHREVEQLFAEFQSSDNPSVAARICDELTKHTFGEEQTVYPIVAKRVDDGKSIAQEAEREHKEARQLIGRIRNTTDRDHLRQLMTELERAIQHHVREEEQEMLPKARQELDTATLDDLGAQFEEAKQSASASG
jgi:iron-sulfur cluster repair protein YtfE (RIC family)